MKFLGVHMADALLFGIAAVIGVGGIALIVSLFNAHSFAELIGSALGAVLATALALIIGRRALRNPTPFAEPIRSTEYRRKSASSISEATQG